MGIPIPRTLQWRHNGCDWVSNHQPHVNMNFHSGVYSGEDQRKHQRSASLAFVRGIHRWPVNSPRKRPVMRKMFPFDDVIMRMVFLLKQGLSEAVAIYLYQMSMTSEPQEAEPTLPFRSLQWSHNEPDGVSNHRRLDRLLKHLFKHR